MYKDYYYISEQVYKCFPDLKVSKPIKSGYVNKEIYYIAHIPEFGIIKEFYLSNKPDNFFAFELEDSHVKLDYMYLDFDDDDNEIEEKREFGFKEIKELGFLPSIEECLGLTKEINIAYLLYKLCAKHKINPIDLPDRF